MMATHGDSICEPKIAVRNYEILRANALGDSNRATELTFFLCNGMSAWLRSLQGFVHREIREETPPVFAELDAGQAEVGLVAVLADAILKSARSAHYRR